MNYIVFDLEFNQHYAFSKENKAPNNLKCPFEIIQIGALKLNEDFETISSLDTLIKPEIYTELNPYVKEITGISIEDFHNTKSFKDIYGEFIDFVKGEDNVFVVWGTSDMKELFRNIEYYELDTSLVPRKYINLQSYCSKYLKCAKGTNIGLSSAIELLNITSNMKFHDAFNDAYYTSEILKKLSTNEIKPVTYNPHKPRKTNFSKTTVDTTKLIDQFEKMFEREMTIEEKSIIKLAYIMGKTHQFQIESPKKTQNER